MRGDAVRGWQSGTRRRRATSQSARLDEDCTLLAALRAESPDAFEELTVRYRLRIVRHGLRFLRDPDEAEDLAQDVLVKVWKHVALFEGDELLWPWMARITANAAISRLRARRRDTPHGASGVPRVGRQSPEHKEPADQAPWADQETCLAQFREQAAVALQGLPDRYRGAVHLIDFRGYSTTEASRSLGVPVPTVKSRAIRGRRLLRLALTAFQNGVTLRVAG